MFKKDYRNTIRESNSLDPEQCQHFVGPITGLHRLEKYLNIQDCLEKSLKINFALKST